LIESGERVVRPLLGKCVQSIFNGTRFFVSYSACRRRSDSFGSFFSAEWGTRQRRGFFSHFFSEPKQRHYPSHPTLLLTAGTAWSCTRANKTQAKSVYVCVATTGQLAGKIDEILSRCPLEKKSAYPPLLVGFSSTLSKCVCDEHWSDLVLFSRCMSLSMTAESDGPRGKEKKSI
jgi:hypothetical protein